MKNVELLKEGLRDYFQGSDYYEPHISGSYHLAEIVSGAMGDNLNPAELVELLKGISAYDFFESLYCTDLEGAIEEYYEDEHNGGEED